MRHKREIKDGIDWICAGEFGGSKSRCSIGQIETLQKNLQGENMFAEQLRVGANIMPHPTRKVQGIIIGLKEMD